MSLFPVDSSLNSATPKSFVDSSGWGFVGAIASGFLLGRLDALTGLETEISSEEAKQYFAVAIELVDESKFVAQVNLRIFKALQVLATVSQKSSLSQKKSLSVLSEQEKANRAQREVAQAAWAKELSKFKQRIFVGGICTVLFVAIGMVKIHWNQVERERYSGQIEQI